MSYQIAIDGPAGAGKSTIAKRLAERLGFIYVDTGAMYRAMALYFIRKGIASSDQAAIEGACPRVKVEIVYEGREQQVLLNGENVTGLIRTEEVGNMTSQVSVYPAVREKLVELQRELAEKEDVIMDGRDIGTCVLPAADLKIYLTASVQARAGRRYSELAGKGETPVLSEIERDIEERDYRDMHREVSPLKQAEDAVLLDSSDMGIDEVVEAVLRLKKDRGEQHEGDRG